MSGPQVLLMLLGALVGFGAAPRPAVAFVCLDIGRCVVWRPPTAHMKFQLGFAPGPLSNGTVSFDENAIAAAEDWNLIGSRFRFSYQTGAPFIDPCGPQGSGHVCANTGPAGDNPVYFTNTLCGRGFGDVLAQTTNCYETGDARMVNAPVFFDASVNWDAYDGPLRPRYDIRRVLAHELGHVLGLIHPDDHGQAVQALMNRRVSNLDRPQGDDINGVMTLYNPASNDSAASGGGCAIARTDSSWLSWMAVLPVLLGWHRHLRARPLPSPPPRAKDARRGRDRSHSKMRKISRTASS
ncbi:MAG TPA: matrixin family metalloprotease [Terriglobales bacterium]|nr:matrixin family metalloprotease [Terriglobales bacterium]